MSYASAMAKGAFWGLVAAFIWINRVTFLMVFLGLGLGGWLVAWYWNDDANMDQMRAAVDRNSKAEVIRVEPLGDGYLAHVMVQNLSQYDMYNIRIVCAGVSSSSAANSVLSNEETVVTVHVDQNPTLPCGVKYEPVDRLKLGESETAVVSAGSF